MIVCGKKFSLLVNIPFTLLYVCFQINHLFLFFRAQQIMSTVIILEWKVWVASEIISPLLSLMSLNANLKCIKIYRCVYTHVHAERTTSALFFFASKDVFNIYLFCYYFKSFPPDILSVKKSSCIWNP